jgi:hypothetical protein
MSLGIGAFDPDIIYMWNGIYKAEMIRSHHIMLNETSGASFQDTGFVMQSFMSSEKSAYIDEYLY